MAKKMSPLSCCWMLVQKKRPFQLFMTQNWSEEKRLIQQRLLIWPFEHTQRKSWEKKKVEDSSARQIKNMLFFSLIDKTRRKGAFFRTADCSQEMEYSAFYCRFKYLGLYFDFCATKCNQCPQHISFQ